MRELIIKIKNKHRGETLLEVMIALAIIGILLIAIFDLLNTSIWGIASTKNRVIALNLSREGLELTRNWRDTNWLKFSGNIREKWNCYDDDNGICNKVNGASKIYFIAKFDESHVLEQSTKQSDLDLINSTDLNDFSDYLIKTSGENFGHNFSSPPESVDTIFYRQIVLTPEFSNKCNDSNINSCNEKKIKVNSVVKWLERDQEKTLTLETYLFDYYNRSSY